MGPATSRTSRRTTIDQTDAARLLASLPLGQLPKMSWTITEVGGLTANPPPHAKPADHQRAFNAWVRWLGLDPDPVRDRCVTVHLRAQGVIDGVVVTLWSVYRP